MLRFEKKKATEKNSKKLSKIMSSLPTKVTTVRNFRKDDCLPGKFIKSSIHTIKDLKCKRYVCKLERMRYYLKNTINRCGKYPIEPVNVRTCESNVKDLFGKQCALNELEDKIGCACLQVDCFNRRGYGMDDNGRKLIKNVKALKRMENLRVMCPWSEESYVKCLEICLGFLFFEK